MLRQHSAKVRDASYHIRFPSFFLSALIACLLPALGQILLSLGISRRWATITVRLSVTLLEAEPHFLQLS
jgi:hypothetical protein